MMRSEVLRNALFVLSLLVFGAVAGFGGYYAGGRSDAIDDARPLVRLADKLIARGEGAEGLGTGRQALLLALQSPQAANRSDMSGASLAPLSHGLARQLASESSDPRFSKIRQAGYASGLKTELSEAQLLAVWLETVDMGRGPHGWLRGFYHASRSVYHRAPDQLNDTEFVRLLAVATAPTQLWLDAPDPALEARVARIRKSFDRRCRASAGNADALAFCLST